MGGFPFPGKEEMSVGGGGLPGGKIGALSGPRGPPVSAGIGGGNDRDVCTHSYKPVQQCVDFINTL